MSPDLISFRRLIDNSLRHLLSEQNRDRCAPAYGCFDRRYWGWKLIDFPEATFQRNVYPIAWWLRHPSEELAPFKEEITTAVAAGLQYAFRIQHRDGSFDQAFPNEHSYGATAFLVQPLLEAYQIIRDTLVESDCRVIEDGLKRASYFLVNKAETHDLISNHLAGAGAALLTAGAYFHEEKFTAGGWKIINAIIEEQSPEGWYPEYGGADPGYQTLCLYYLAQAYRLQPEPALKKSLERSVEFLSWFVHPDGSFGGEYGSRRTSVYYPGGIALLAHEIPAAAAMTDTMIESILRGSTVTLRDIDTGNLAPLLQSSILAMDALDGKTNPSGYVLPCHREEASIDFPEAGLFIRGNKTYFAVTGTSNGGVIKVFRKADGQKVYDDGGYFGILKGGRYISTQMTRFDRPVVANGETIQLKTPFYKMLRSLPTPFQFTLLRMANITFMRSILIGNWIKRLLVNLLIRGEKCIPMRLDRKITFTEKNVVITDDITLEAGLYLQILECGVPFTSIHMASARYFQGQPSSALIHPEPVDVSRLRQDGHVNRRIII